MNALQPRPCPLPPAEGALVCYGCNTYVRKNGVGHSVPFWCEGCRESIECFFARMGA